MGKQKTTRKVSVVKKLISKNDNRIKANQVKQSKKVKELEEAKQHAPRHVDQTPNCVMAELEKLGSKFRLALRLAKDPRFERLPCTHSGTYADDCLVERCQQHRCYIVATCDRDLKRRIRKIPGVPIMYINSHKYSIERLPEAFGAPPQ
eukprot:gene20845-27015_t